MAILMLSGVSAKKFLPFVLCVCLFLTCEGRAVDNKHLNKKNVIKTIKSSDGDVFDCVDMYKQPSFDHPLLKDHKLQMKPTSEPKVLLNLDVAPPENLFSQFEEECPDGYIPIQRLQRNDITGSNHSLGLRASFLSTQASPNDHIKDAMSVRIAKELDEGWLGGGAQLNVYGIPQVTSDQMSSTAFWVVNTDVLVLLTAGWMVNPTVYKDSKTRLSLSWTMNGTVADCYDLRCPGFVQTNKNIYLGSTITPLSVYNGKQTTINVYIYKDIPTGNWWFSFHDPKNYVGYWPKEAFPKGLDRAKSMIYGGYVSCPSFGNCPQMGNGAYPSNDNGDPACYVNQVVFVSAQMEFLGLIPKSQYGLASHPTCYGLGSYNKEGEYTYRFTFGGSEC